MGQARRLGVGSLPIGLFIAAFTGIVLALLASYSFTGAVPMYFVGTLVGKTVLLELAPVLTGLALAGRVGANIAAETRDDARHRADRRARDARLRPARVPRGAARDRGHGDVPGRRRRGDDHGHRMRMGRVGAAAAPLERGVREGPAAVLSGVRRALRAREVGEFRTCRHARRRAPGHCAPRAARWASAPPRPPPWSIPPC